jgi:O-glycosyl hydrolase
MVIVAINKANTAHTAEIAITHTVELSRAQAYRITAATPAVVAGPAPGPSARNLYRVELPASSVTTLVLTR